MIVGPAIGALLLILGPPSVVFGVNATTFALSAFLVSRVHIRSKPTDVTDGGATGPLEQMTAGITAFVASPTVTLLAGFRVLASLVYGTDTVLFRVVSRYQLVHVSAGHGLRCAGSSFHRSVLKRSRRL